MISFLIPSSDNLPYLKNAYASIKKYAPDDCEIIILDDFSSDGTFEWGCDLTNSNHDDYDENVKFYRQAKVKVGHTVLYNVGAELATKEIISILHADMFIGPYYVENLLNHIHPGVVVSATRVEPPLHPSGKEKIVKNFGMYPEDFMEQEFYDFVKEQMVDSISAMKTTRGIFAPWAIYKEDYLSIGGHDELFAPYPYEDSDIFQRFILAGYKLIQSWDAMVYHFTCRGHKWTDDTKLGEVHDKFNEFELNARRNFLRKWHSWIRNDEYHHPILTPVYRIGYIVTDFGPDEDWRKMLYDLEPLADAIYCKWDSDQVEGYKGREQSTTSYDLSKRVFWARHKMPELDVMVYVDGRTFTPRDYQYLTALPLILEEMNNELSNEFAMEGQYEIGNVTVKINRLHDYSKEIDWYTI